MIILLSNRQRPTFPGSFPPSIIGAGELNFCVRDGYRCLLPAIVTGYCSSFAAIAALLLFATVLMYTGTFRSSLIARLALPAKSFAFIARLSQNFITITLTEYQSFVPWSSVRPISTSQLNTLLYLHLRPINVVVSHGSYLKGGNLFLWGASHLDAFSTYPIHR